MNKLLLTIIIISTLLCSGCLETFSSEYKRGYNDGYNNPDEETLQCVIDYYNKCIDYYNVVEYDRYNHVEHREYGYAVFDKTWNSFSYVRYGTIFYGMDGKLTDKEYELYCAGYMAGISDNITDTKRMELEMSYQKEVDDITAELNNMSECR